ncbi:protein C1orf43 homolog isoform X3 [Heterodontus francisci]
MRFAMKSRRGPHVPIGHSAPKDLREEIDRSLLKVQDLDYEPQLLDEGDVRLLQLQEPGSQVRYNYLYRMKALDAIRHVDLPIGEGADFAKRLTGKSFRSFLLELREGNIPFRGVRKNLIDKLIDGYEAARYGTTHSGAEHPQSDTAPDCSKGPDLLFRDLLAHHHPGHLPTVQPEEQEAQAFPGAEELQGELQHTGEHVVRAQLGRSPTRPHPALNSPVRRKCPLVRALPCS